MRCSLRPNPSDVVNETVPVAVVQPDRRDGADDHATGRREVAERGRDVAADDLVLAIVPVHDGPLAP